MENDSETAHGGRVRTIDLWWSAGGTLIAANRTWEADGWSQWLWGLLSAFFLVGTGYVVARLARQRRGGSASKATGS